MYPPGIYFNIQGMLDICSPDPKLEQDLRRELNDLADEINSNLAGHHVWLAHYDTGDYLVFLKETQTK